MSCILILFVIEHVLYKTNERIFIGLDVAMYKDRWQGMFRVFPSDFDMF